MNAIFDKSILVAAHPDDEVLWSSSILTSVDEIVLCFLGIESEPETQQGRQSSLGAYPLRNVSCLGLDEAGTFYGVDWNDPVLTPYGIKITDRKYPDKAYRENYHRLKDQLRHRLSGYSNVFTHNPWGEYGNDEHIQVYRAVRDLQGSMGFKIWYSNYASNKSFRLMVDYLNTSELEYVIMQTNRELAHTVKSLYTAHHCWTWYDDWQWQAEEAFISDTGESHRAVRSRCAVPINMIRVWLPAVPKTAGLFQRDPLSRIRSCSMMSRIAETVSLNHKNI